MTAPAENWLDGKYELLGKIGQGGMGAVFKARHRLLDEVRVIKVLRSEQAEREELQKRFVQEARTAIRLKHPGIAQLHDFAVADDGTAFIVMEYIEGIPLDATLRTVGRLPATIAVHLARQTLEALHYLHQQGYVHRDIAPDNLMLCRGLDDKPQLKLIDLGIARHVESGTSLTTTGSFVGKVRYSSPEQFTDSREVDARSDVYSFGLILYEMMVGQHPLPGDTFQVMAASHLFTEPKDFGETDPDDEVPEAVREVVLRTLSKKADERFDSAAQLAEALSALDLAPPSTADLESLFLTAMESRQEFEAAGTTDQNRLDEEFRAAERTGAQESPSPSASPAQAAGAGDTSPTTLQPAPEAAAPSANDRRRESSGRRRSSPLLLVAGLAGIAVLALLFVFWYRGSSTKLPDEAELAASGAVRVAPASEGPLPVPGSDGTSAPNTGTADGLAAEAPTEDLESEASEPIPDAVALGGDAASREADPQSVTENRRPEPAAASQDPPRSGSRAETTEALQENTPSGVRIPAQAPAAAEPSGPSPSPIEGGGEESEPIASTPSAPEVQLEIVNDRRRTDALRFRRGYDEMPRVVGEFEAPAPAAGSGAAIYEFTVRLDETGAVLEIRAVGEPPDIDYSQALENALVRTRFRPGLRKGQPIRGQFRARVLVN